MTAHQMLAKVRDLPPVSRAALEITSLLASSNTANDDIVRVIRQDSVLTAKLLRACNSPVFGLKERVTSLDQAILMLGHNQISQMATALAFRGPLSVPLSAYGMNLWQHSLRAASAAEALVKTGVNLGIDSSTAFTIGLLHDIGKLVTTEFLTREAMIAIRERIVEGQSAVEAERAVLGADHAEVGGSMLYLWRLPEPLIEGVALHHQSMLAPPPRIPTLTAIANMLANHGAAAQGSQATYPAINAVQLAKALGVAPEVVDSVFARICEPLEVCGEYLALSV